MKRLVEHWRKIVYIFLGLKLLAILLVPVAGPGADFGNWIENTKSIVEVLLAGTIPALSTYGVYIGIEIMLAPFFWVWSILPINHPTLMQISAQQYTLPVVLLALFMKTPILLADLSTFTLLLRIVHRITGSKQKSIIAGLAWFLNPFNFYMLYYFGAMDVIPTAFFLLAIYFELKGQWFRCGISMTFSGLLRLFAFVAYPFLFLLTNRRRKVAWFLTGSVIPLILTIGMIYLSRDTLTTVFSIPANQSWLLEFLGWNVLGTQFIRMSPVLVLVQLYAVARFWGKNPNIIHLAASSLLALSLGATLYGGEAQHFIWVSPLLSACLALRLEELWIFAATFFTALVAPTVNPFYLWTPQPILLNTFLAGAFYAAKAAYLLKLNLSNAGIL